MSKRNFKVGFESQVVRVLTASLLIQAALPAGITSAGRWVFTVSSYAQEGSELTRAESAYQAALANSRTQRAEAERLRKVLIAAQEKSKSADDALSVRESGVNDIAGRIRELEAQDSALDAQAQSLQQEAIRARSDLSGDQTILIQVQRDLLALQNQIAPLDQDVSRSRQEYDALLIDLQNSDARLKTAQENFDRSTIALNDLIVQRDQLMQSIRAMDQERQGLDREAQVLPGRISQLNQQITDMNGRIATLTQAVRDQEAIVGPLRTRVQGANQAVSVLNQAVRDKKSALDRANKALADSDSAATAAQTVIGTSDAAIAALNTELATKKTDNDALAANVIAAQAVVDKAEADIKAGRAEIDRIEAELRGNVDNARRVELGQRIRDIRSVQEPALIKTRNANKSRIDASNERIRQNTMRINAISGDITSRERAKVDAQGKLDRLNQGRAALVATQTQATTEHQEATIGLTAAQADLTQSQAALKAAEPALIRAQNDLNPAIASRDRLSQELRTAQERLKFVGIRRGELDRFAVDSARTIQDFDQRRIPFARNQNNQNSTEFSTISSRNSNLRARAEQAYAVLTPKIDQLNRLNESAQKLSQRQGELNQEIQSLSQLVSNKELQRKQALDQISVNNRELAQLRSGGAQDATLAELRQAASAARQTLSRAEADFSAADLVAQKAEQKSDAALAELERVRSVIDARTQGARKKGQVAGSSQGATDGAALGSREGQISASLKGLLSGKNQGELDGKTQGARDGRAEGVNRAILVLSDLSDSAVNQAAAGKKQGEKDAQDLARVSERQKGRNAKLAELVAAITQAPKSLNSGLLGTGSDRVVISGAAQGQIEAAVIVASGSAAQATCDQADLESRDSCKRAFVEAYQDEFVRSYTSEKESSENAAIDSARQKAYASAKSAAYSVAYSESYAQAMRETFAKEAANYDRASFETARTQAIQNTLATAQASQTWQGRAEIRDAALAGPLVSVLGASVGKSELGLTTIDVSIANVGLVAPAGSVRIQARSLSADLIVDDRSLVAGELPAQSRIKLEQVVLIQKSEASTNRGPLAVELSITLPNGKIVVQKVTL